jgi:hypothetical protein
MSNSAISQSIQQRCQHSLKLRNEKSQLTDEREKKLNDIGFSWVAPGFSKKTVTMPGDEEEAEAVQQQAMAHMAAQQQLLQQQQMQDHTQQHSVDGTGVEEADAGGLTGVEYSAWNV